MPCFVNSVMYCPAWPCLSTKRKRGYEVPQDSFGLHFFWGGLPGLVPSFSLAVDGSELQARHCMFDVD